MNPQILAILQVVLTFVAGILASRGLISQEMQAYLASPEALAVVGALIGAIVGAWTLWNRRPKGIAADAANTPGVKAVIADPKIANSSATPGNVVTSATEAARLPGVPN